MKPSKTTSDRGDWIETASGRKFWPSDPRPDEVHLRDVVVALSNMCRFGGHLSWFYSVSQHSVHVSRLVRRPLALRALFHDAAEAYVVDVPRPIKKNLVGYKELEEGVLHAIESKMGWDPGSLAVMHPEVVVADNIALVTEWRDLRVRTQFDWGIRGGA